MEPLPPVFQSLSSSKNLAADDLLLATLPALEPPYQIHAINTMLKRQQPTTLEALIQNYDGLPERCKLQLAKDIGLLETTLRQTMRSTDEVTRRKTIDLITLSGSCAMSYLLSMGLSGSSSNIRGRAALALRALSTTFADELDQGKWVPSRLNHLEEYYAKFRELGVRRDLLLSAMRQALVCYDTHRRTSVIEAVTRMSLYLEDELLAEAGKAQSRCWRAIVEMLRDDPQPMAAPLALQALKNEHARADIAAVISGCQHEPFMIALVQHSWLLGDARIYQGCQSIRRLAWLEANPAPLFHLSAPDLGRALRFIAASGVSDEHKIHWYRSILLSLQKDKQRAALFAITAIKSEATSEVLRVMVDWADRHLAGLALRELIHRRAGDLAQLAERYHNKFAQAGDQPAAPALPYDQFQQLWDHYEDMPNALRGSAGRRLLAVDSSFIPELAVRLESADPADRIRAVQIVRTLRLAKRFRERVLDLTRDTDRVVRSGAVKALADLEDGTATMVLTGALEDPDRRVRANAIEALDELGSTQRVAKLKPRLQDDDHRVRATAVKALLKLKVREAATSLIELLQHPLPTHRVSALWVIEKYGLATVLAQVSAIAEEDPDEKVRMRAKRLLRNQRMKTRYRKAAIPPPAEEHPS